MIELGRRLLPMVFRSRAADAGASPASRGAVNDGRWHHVIAEADRTAKTFTIQVDGKQDARGAGLGGDASPVNGADLYIGGTPRGHNLDGAIESLRIARGTLADAKTTVDALHAWEFGGPFPEDFNGRKRPADGGAAGAVDEAARAPRTGARPAP